MEPNTDTRTRSIAAVVEIAGLCPALSAAECVYGDRRRADGLSVRAAVARSAAILPLLLLLGSALMYMAGMVLNDVFDVEVDRVERPERPLPSGRIAVGWARWLGFEMLFVGAALGVLVGVMRAIHGRRSWPCCWRC